MDKLCFFTGMLKYETCYKEAPNFLDRLATLHEITLIY